MKTISAIIAASVLFGSAAYAQPTTLYSVTTTSTEPLTNGPNVADSMPRVPLVMPFVSDRTAKRYAVKNFQPGPFNELGPDDKVDWRR